MTDSAALVLFSSGQDSTVCLAWALKHYERVETVGFRYGQRHVIEIEQREVLLDLMREHPDWGGRLGPDTVLELPALAAVSETSLTRDIAIELSSTGLPSTFVPGRNLLFLTYAGALAYRRGIETLVGGMCETDYSGYPDCRRATLDALQKALTLGMDRALTIETPLMHASKADTWALAQTLGGTWLVEAIVEHSHTCYLGERGTRHEWGYGCGHCPACALRAKGWWQWRGGPGSTPQTDTSPDTQGQRVRR